MMYRLRDINTGTIAAPPKEFDADTYRPAMGWIIEFSDSQPYDASPRWKVYRQMTAAELVELLEADLEEIQRWHDQATERLSSLRAML